MDHNPRAIWFCFVFFFLITHVQSHGLILAQKHGTSTMEGSSNMVQVHRLPFPPIFLGENACTISINYVLLLRRNPTKKNKKKKTRKLQAPKGFGEVLLYLAITSTPYYCNFLTNLMVSCTNRGKLPSRFLVSRTNLKLGTVR